MKNEQVRTPPLAIIMGTSTQVGPLISPMPLGGFTRAREKNVPWIAIL